MYLGKVIGNVVSTTKSEKLTGLKLLLVQQVDMLTMKATGAPAVIVDAVGAGVGELVMVVTGGSSRLTEETTGRPVDGTICGIIDTIDLDGTLIFEKYPKASPSSLASPLGKEAGEKTEPQQTEAKAEEKHTSSRVTSQKPKKPSKGKQ